jgi:hypothetical protein
MSFYFEESSCFFPKKIDKDLKEHTFSCQLCFVSPQSVISAKKIDSFAKSKVDFFSQKKNTSSSRPIPGNWDIEVTIQIKLYIREVVFFTIF